MFDLQVPLFVVSKEYCTAKESSVTFIRNIKERVHYVISGNVSMLWNYIINSQNYDEIKTFSIKNNFENILDGFLGELKAKNLIQLECIAPNFDDKYLRCAINEKSANFDAFVDKKDMFVRSLGLLNILRLCLNFTCNLNCKHCCNPKNIYDEIAFFQAKSIIDEAITLGVSHINLTGGECTINKDFLKIAKYIRSKFLSFSVFTNGQKLFDDEAFFYDVISTYPSSVQISLYSMNSEIHDNLTSVKGSHYKTLNIIKKLRKYDINVAVTCTQTSYNCNSYKDVKQFAESIGCTFMTDCKFINNPNNNNLCAKLSIEDVEKFYMERIDINNLRKNSLNCLAGYDRIEILPNLDINPCTYFNYFLGNYKNISLTEVRKTTVLELHKLLRKENLKDCFKHEYCDYCFYCPIYTCYEEDGFLKKSEILCEDARAYYSALKKIKANKN